MNTHNQTKRELQNNEVVYKKEEIEKDEQKTSKKKYIRLLLLILGLISIALIIFLSIFLRRKKDDQALYDSCEIGDNEKCLTCDPNTNQCSSCNPGYFVPDDAEIKNECQKCNIDKCIKCSGSKDSNICEECAFSYKPTNGICESKYYLIEAIYEISENNEKVKLMEKIENLLIKEVKLDGEIINIYSEIISRYEGYYYDFPLSGKHNVSFLIDLENCNSLSKMFSSVRALAEISFTKFELI